jgi:hypothetical protein
MTHYCTACSSEFDDDTGPLPQAEFVHCVFCGARIHLAPPHKPGSVVPFSKDYEREEAFALGVINRTGPGFPDTLRQFRVPTRSPGGDSLAPQTQGSERPPAALVGREPRKLTSLAASLSIGFGVGVAIAFGVVSLSSKNVTSRPAPRASSAPQATGVLAASAHAAPSPPSPVATAPASLPAVAASSIRKPPTPQMERRFLLERARSAQRAYRLAEAERLYSQVLLRAPRDSEAMTGLGELALLRGTVDLAAARFEEALAANSNYIPARIAVADILWQSGRVDEARAAYQDIVEHHEPDAYPPYVVQRSSPVASPPCER